MPSSKSRTSSHYDAEIMRSIVDFLYEKNIHDAIPPILLSTNIGFLDSSLENHQELMGLQKLVLKGKFEDALGEEASDSCSIAILSILKYMLSCPSLSFPNFHFLSSMI